MLTKKLAARMAAGWRLKRHAIASRDRDRRSIGTTRTGAIPYRKRAPNAAVGGE
jgi:hypothetical protein